MKTNFFELVAGLSLNGNLHMIIQRNENGTQNVALLLSPGDPKTTIGKSLPPLSLKGSPQELDETFFQRISQPIKETAKLYSNAEAYQKELEKAKKQVAAEKDKNTTVAAPKAADNNLFSPQPEEEHGDDFEESLDEQPDEKESLAEKQRLYDEAMQRVNTLNGQMKYAEAIAQLPVPEEFPDKTEEIKNKGEALLKRQEMYASLQQEI